MDHDAGFLLSGSHAPISDVQLWKAVLFFEPAGEQQSSPFEASIACPLHPLIVNSVCAAYPLNEYHWQPFDTDQAKNRGHIAPDRLLT